VHKETLEALLDEDKFRDALAKFDIAEDGGQIAREHRPELLNVWHETKFLMATTAVILNRNM
jgi:hypothetical protein